MMDPARWAARAEAALEPGRSYYLRARLHDPDQRVTLVRFLGDASTQLCVVRKPRGLEPVCASAELSVSHPETWYRRLRAG